MASLIAPPKTSAGRVASRPAMSFGQSFSVTGPRGHCAPHCGFLPTDGNGHDDAADRVGVDHRGVGVPVVEWAWLTACGGYMVCGG